MTCQSYPNPILCNLMNAVSKNFIHNLLDLVNGKVVPWSKRASLLARLWSDRTREPLFQFSAIEVFQLPFVIPTARFLLCFGWHYAIVLDLDHCLYFISIESVMVKLLNSGFLHWKNKRLRFDTQGSCFYFIHLSFRNHATKFHHGLVDIFFCSGSSYLLCASVCSLLLDEFIEGILKAMHPQSGVISDA